MINLELESTKSLEMNSSSSTFSIEFQEDGTPLDCFKFVRFPAIKCHQLVIRFKIPEAFISEGETFGIEVKPCAFKGPVFREMFKTGQKHVDYELKTPGTFNYYLVSDGKVYMNGSIQTPPQFIPQNDIRAITMISKWMDPLQDWPKYFDLVKNQNYNFIHFTPLQQRGLSNSPYSICDQLQLSDDLFQSNYRNLGNSERHLQLKEMISKELNQNYGIFGMIDVVWNHTACDSKWLAEHPEAGYNLDNSPHLSVAFDLDEAILSFSSRLEEYKLTGWVNNEDGINSVLDIFFNHHLPQTRLWEYFVIDVEAAEGSLMIAIGDFKSSGQCHYLATDSLQDALYFDEKHHRGSYKMDAQRALGYFHDKIKQHLLADPDEDGTLSQIIHEYRREMEELNLAKYQKYDECIRSIRRNIFNRVKYERIADNGPRLGRVCKSSPLVSTYFTRIPKKDGSGTHALANNGWIWNVDPFKNFAEVSSDAYLTREVIVWGDCVKLNYGQSPKDSPWLWNHMADYTRQMADIFHAFRIDNCHSTPIHVAEYLLHEARKVRPDIYVCAELFTGSAEKDMIFVTRLGINSLIREAMVAWDSREIARLTTIYGGQPLGSMQRAPEYLTLHSKPPQEIRTFSFSRPHNIFFDCTHDNEPPAQKRTAQDTLSNSAIVAFSCCATGSTFGHDQIVPHHMNIVEEPRKYFIENNCEFAQMKNILNQFHSQLEREGCSEVFTQSVGSNLLVISRDNPEKHFGYTLITRNAYSPENLNSSGFFEGKESVYFPKSSSQVIFCAAIEIENGFERNTQFINGLKHRVHVHREEIPKDWGILMQHGLDSELILNHLPAGSVIVLKRSLNFDLQELREQALDLTKLRDLAQKLDLIDLNHVLYRSEAEERDAWPHAGIYKIPDYGDLWYCGLQGMHSLLSLIARHNELDHPLCGNIRDGDWLMDYTMERLERCPQDHIRALSLEWFKPQFTKIRQLPNYLKPKYLWRVIDLAFGALHDRALEQMNPAIGLCNELGKKLALGSVQMIGTVPSTGLKPFGNPQATLSAGLPHFSTHHMRCWGRDVFIAFRGMFLLTGRFDLAREHLMAFAGCLYRGLIPNLLDSARRPRYNARDSTWWFLYALQQYCKESPEGHGILEESIALRFPTNEYIDYDSTAIFSRSEPLKRIVQGILQSHAEGIHFREWRAGAELDQVMQWEGFNVDIAVDWRTGFLHGGNRYNCGTWMDKMGESCLAGNRGIPSTPRDGAPIEITALLKYTLDWLASLTDFGFFGVERQPKTSERSTAGHGYISFADWSSLIQNSFEGEYFIPEDADELMINDSMSEFSVDSALIRRRGIYKDCVGGHDLALNYQMRPNYLLAMAIAPSLFTPRRARRALALAEDHLTGPLGMKTLDPADPCYRPNYENSQDSPDFLTAKGANYHQGPEWIWCMGFYLRAWLTFNLSTTDLVSARKLVLTRLRPHRYHLFHSPAASLPELNGKNGAPCRDSCWTQAWSMACILEVVMQAYRCDYELPNE